MIILVHDLEIHLVVNLEAFGLDLLLPVIIVDLNVVEDGVDEHADVGVLVRQELKHDRYHLGLV